MIWGNESAASTDRDIGSIYGKIIRNCRACVHKWTNAQQSRKENRMSKNMDVFKRYFDMVYANPPASVIEANEKYLADDYKNFDKDGNVAMDKKTYIEMGKLLFKSFEDLEYITSDIREDGNSVVVSGHFKGTHTGDLDLTSMGVGVIPASGKMVVWPESSTKFNIEGDKIVSQQDVGDNGGVGEFLKLLGVALPSA
jgi:predicted ester cyclase